MATACCPSASFAEFPQQLESVRALKVDEPGLSSCRPQCPIAKRCGQAVCVRSKIRFLGGRTMTLRFTTSFAAAVLAGALGAGCANDGNLSTAGISPEKAAAQQASKVDPACVSLTSQIETLRKEGAVERLEKAAEGKSSSVQVKRASLAKQAELNKANADFQMKCGPKIPAPQTAQTAPAPQATTDAKTAAAQVAPIATPNAQGAAAATATAAQPAAEATAKTAVKAAVQ